MPLAAMASSAPTTSSPGVLEPHHRPEPPHTPLPGNDHGNGANDDNDEESTPDLSVPMYSTQPPEPSERGEDDVRARQLLSQVVSPSSCQTAPTAMPEEGSTVGESEGREPMFGNDEFSSRTNRDEVDTELDVNIQLSGEQQETHARERPAAETSGVSSGPSGGSGAGGSATSSTHSHIDSNLHQHNADTLAHGSSPMDALQTGGKAAGKFLPSSGSTTLSSSTPQLRYPVGLEAATDHRAPDPPQTQPPLLPQPEDDDQDVGKGVGAHEEELSAHTEHRETDQDDARKPWKSHQRDQYQGRFAQDVAKEERDLAMEAEELFHEPVKPKSNASERVEANSFEVQVCCLCSAFLKTYCRQIVRRPIKLCFLFIFILLIPTVITLALRDHVLEKGFAGFIKADGDAARRSEALGLAGAQRKGLNGRRLQVTANMTQALPIYYGEAQEEELQEDELDDALMDALEEPEVRRLSGSVYVRRELFLMYKAKAGSVLDERVMREIRDFEYRLKHIAQWRSLCENSVSQNNRGLCHTGVSFAALTWPSKTPTTEFPGVRFTFDGKGRDMLAMPTIFEYMQRANAPQRELALYFPKDIDISPVHNRNFELTKKTSLLRSKFEFRLQAGSTSASLTAFQRTKEKVSNEYHSLILDHVYPFLIEEREKLSHVNLYYVGDVISGYEVSKTLNNDLLFSIGSLSFVALYMWLHTGSIVVTITGLFVIFASVPFAYVLTPAAKTTIASLVSIFLAIGIGCDDVFVFMDFWHQSKHLDDVDLRLEWTMVRAIRSCLATSVTTSISFFANLASCLQPLREFGMFMGLCVMGACFLMFVFLPPVVVAREFRQRGPRARIIDVSAGESGALAALEDAGKGAGGTANMKRKLSRGRFFLLNLVGWIAGCPISVCVVTAVLGITFLVTSVAMAQVDTGIPEIFPAGHNQVEAPVVQGKFSDAKRFTFPSALVESSCTARYFGGEGWQCRWDWCHAVNRDGQGHHADDMSGSCWASPVYIQAAPNVSLETLVNSSSQRCISTTIRTRVAAAVRPSEPDWGRMTRPLMEQLVQDWNWTAQQTFERGPPAPVLVLEDWETGQVRLSNYHQMDTYVSFKSRSCTSGDGGSCTAVPCEVRTMCFFGTPVCELNGWTKLGDGLSLPRRLSPENSSMSTRLLSQVILPVVPHSQQIGLEVVWGIQAARSTPLLGPPKEQWTWDPTFEGDNPWAQRAVYDVCTKTTPDLMVLERSCWIELFKTWLSARGRRFPSRDFLLDLGQWWGSTVRAKENIWIKDGKFVACKVGFRVNFSQKSGSSKILEYKKRWDHYIATRNAAASITASAAWHAAATWVSAEAEQEILKSTQDTVIISCASGWIGMMVFTRDPVLAFYVLTLVMGIISGLAFFMVVLLGWTIGPIEVICLVVFVGYSVTYSLHIAHEYSEVGPDDEELFEMEKLAIVRRKSCSLVCSDADKEEKLKVEEGEDTSDEVAEEMARQSLATSKGLRIARVRLAVLHLGCASASSAVTTVMGTVFLLPCTITIFLKFGAVVIVVTLLSLVVALVSLPAVLMLAGPSPDPWYCRIIRECRDHTVNFIRAKMQPQELYACDEDGHHDQSEPFVSGHAIY